VRNKFNFTFKDIENFFKNKKSHWPDEEFLANQLEQKDIHFLTQKMPFFNFCLRFHALISYFLG